MHRGTTAYSNERFAAGLHEALRAALATLSREERLILRLHLWDQVPLTQVAGILGRPRKSLYAPWKRALSALGGELAQQGIEWKRVEELLEAKPDLDTDWLDEEKESDAGGSSTGVGGRRTPGSLERNRPKDE